ncbi:MAG: hypothetical protein ACI9LE_001509, partial [Paraglaciecola sp.]
MVDTLITDFPTKQIYELINISACITTKFYFLEGPLLGG